MFGATFNLVTPCRTNVVFATLTDGSLGIYALALTIVSATESSSQMAPTLVKNGF